VPKAALEAEAAHVASAVGIPTPTVVTDRIGR
jgi:hypothetical protein